MSRTLFGGRRVRPLDRVGRECSAGSIRICAPQTCRESSVAPPRTWKATRGITAALLPPETPTGMPSNNRYASPTCSAASELKKISIHRFRFSYPTDIRPATFYHVGILLWRRWSAATTPVLGFGWLPVSSVPTAARVRVNLSALLVCCWPFRGGVEWRRRAGRWRHAGDDCVDEGSGRKDSA